MTTTKVNSEFIAVNAISGTIIADGAITSTHLAVNSVDSSELVTGSIDTIHIAANQVTATKIVTNGVLTRHISDDQVTADKLANSINTDIATGVTGNTTANAALPKAGGTMTGALAMNANAITSTGDLTLDVATNIVLDADGGGIYFKDGGTTVGFLQNDGGDFRLVTSASDKDFKILGNDGGSTITALSLDMSNGGRANFNNDIGLNDDRGIRLGSDDDSVIYNDGSNLYIKNSTSNHDIIFQGNDDGSAITALTLDMSAAGAATFNSSVNAANLLISGAQGSDGQVLTSTGSGIAWEDAAGGVAGISSSADATAITIDSSERVGIGTGSPARELHIHDPSSDNVYLMLSNTTSGAASGDGFQLFTDGTNAGVLNRENGYLKFTTNNTDRMTISNAGNVGLGTSSPSVKLHVEGAGNQLVLVNNSSTSDGLFLKAGTGESSIQTNGGSNVMNFYTSGNERMRIDSSGNVGIGTTSPNQDGFGSTSRVLTVKAPSSGGTGALELIGLANSSGDVMSAINFMSYAVGNPAGRITALRHTADDEATIAFDTSGAERMRITQAGNVGIGTTSPSTELHVYSADQNALTVETNTGVNQIHLSNSTNSPSYITQDSYAIVLKADDNGWGGTASAIKFNVKATERMKIAHDGETTITGTKMNVVSSAEAVMGAQATGNSYWRVVADNSPNTYFQAGTGQSSSQVKMYFTGMYGSNNTMTVDTPNSRVGIGTTSPGKKLDVRGTIRATAANNDISLSDELPGYGANSYGNLKASANHIYLSIGSSYIGYINSSAQLNASDSRLKENVATLTGALDKVNQLRGVSFNWIDSARGEGTHIGFIAQELEEVYPELVGDGGLPNDDDGQSAMKSVDYGHMVAILVEAIKELKAENDALKTRLDAGGL
jgi:hypothetical protein